MGNCCYKKAKVAPWKQLNDMDQTKNKYMADKSIAADSTAEHVQFRALLDEELGMKFIKEYADHNGVMASSLMSLWLSIVEYKPVGQKRLPKIDALMIKLVTITIPSASEPNPTLNKLKEHMKKHKMSEKSATFKTFFSLRFSTDDITPLDDAVTMDATGNAAPPTPSDVVETAFDLLQLVCFQYMFDIIYVPFQESYEYGTMCDELRKSYNNVAPDDFEYLTKIGEGGFGLIVHCRKKTTGKENLK